MKLFPVLYSYDMRKSLNKCTFTASDHEITYDKSLLCKTKCIKDDGWEGQWLSGRVLDSRQRSRGLEPHQRHCIMVFEQFTFILA